MRQQSFRRSSGGNNYYAMKIESECSTYTYTKNNIWTFVSVKNGCINHEIIAEWIVCKFNGYYLPFYVLSQFEETGPDTPES